MIPKFNDTLLKLVPSNTYIFILFHSVDSCTVLIEISLNITCRGIRNTVAHVHTQSHTL